jgi:galacturan 1,4-alpha-galacturonidase
MIAKTLATAFVAALLPATSLAGSLPDGYISGQGGPNYKIGPHQPCRPIPPSPPRTRTCVVKANGNGNDDSANILAALHECNNGGHVIFSKNEKYIIGTALDMTFLNHIDLGKCGHLFDAKFTNAFGRYPRIRPVHKRHHILASKWILPGFPERYHVLPARVGYASSVDELEIDALCRGTDVNVYGGGTLNGNGQVWYDLYAQNDLILRPVLFGTIGLHGGSIGDLHFIQSPEYFNFVANSTDVVFYNLNLTAASHSNNTAKNTDGTSFLISHSRDVI